MPYLDTQRRPNLGSMGAVIVIHGAVGAALILGLSVAGVIKDEDGPTTTWDIPKLPPPPTPPEVRATETARTDIFLPTPPLPLPTAEPPSDITDALPQPGPRPLPGPTLTPAPLPSVTPSFPPVAARPSNDPSRWVTSEDYRGNWIRQELVGKARFRLEIAADGRVAGCTITSSSGHPELDAATCALVTKRARFQPARGSEGEAVAGSYSNAIHWQLPE